MLKRTGQKFIKFCIKNACFILPYPDRGARARFLKNSALFLYVLILLSLQLYMYKLSPQILGFATNIKVDELYSLVNQERSELGLTTLSRNSKLEKAALDKAQDMFSQNYWAHYAPDGSTPWQFIIASGYTYKYAGENLAKDFDTSSGLVAGWMGSASHRANMLNSNYKHVGMAAINGTLLGEETTLVVQMLGTPISTTTSSTSSGSSTSSESGSSTAGAQSEVEQGSGGTSEAEPEPKTIVGPAEVSAEPVSQPPDLAQATLSPLEQIVRVFNPVTSPKTIPLGFGFFLMSLFALDEFAMLKGGLTKSELRRTAENVGHMVILGLLMVLVWVTKVGGVL